jgi:hypothetical protein
MENPIQEEQALDNLVRAVINNEFMAIEQKFSIIQALNQEDSEITQSTKEIIRKYINALEDKHPLKVKLYTSYDRKEKEEDETQTDRNQDNSDTDRSLYACEEMIEVRDGFKRLFIEDIIKEKLSYEQIQKWQSSFERFNSDIESTEICPATHLNTDITKLERCLLDQGIIQHFPYYNEEKLLLTNEQDSCFEQTW